MTCTPAVRHCILLGYFSGTPALMPCTEYCIGRRHCRSWKMAVSFVLRSIQAMTWLHPVLQLSSLL